MLPVRAWFGCWGWREHAFASSELKRTQLFHLIDMCGGPNDAEGFPRDVYLFGSRHLLALHGTTLQSLEVVVREVPDLFHEVVCKELCDTGQPYAYYKVGS